MLDYKNIITKRYALHMTYQQIADEYGASTSGVNDFIHRFEKCDKLSYPLPEGITNYAIHELVYGHVPGANRVSAGYEKPNFEWVFNQLESRKNMTLTYLWTRYAKDCESKGTTPYQYRQFCDLYSTWCNENYETLHFQAVKGEKMEVDFAGKTFNLISKYSGEKSNIVVFVAILPYSQMIYAEGMISTKEPQWIDVNNNALEFFKGVPVIVVCDNCKQAVITNKDWIEPDLNKDYAAWAEHNHTIILPAKVRKPKYKSSVENAVGILEKGLFHDLEERQYFSLDAFNNDLWKLIDVLNHEKFKKKDYSRYDKWEEERSALGLLPSMQYQYMERITAKVSSDFHVRFDNAYYSVKKEFLHKNVLVAASSSVVNIYSERGELIVTWPRATHKGEWFTNKEHLPSSYKDLTDWNGPFFIKKAMSVGPYTVKVIETILKSRDQEVQTYRTCLGVLNFTKKYSRLALEDCSKMAIETNHPTYTYIKTNITAIAEDLGKNGFNTKLNEERNKGAFVMNSHAGDIDLLLNKSFKLARKEKNNEEK